MKKNKDSATHNKIRMKLGRFLKESRKKIGLSQVEFATKLGYETPQFISDWERGVYSPPMKKMLLICELLNIKPDKFFQMILEFNQERLRADTTEQYESIRKSSRRKA